MMRVGTWFILSSCLAGTAAQVFAYSASDRSALLTQLQIRYQNASGKYASQQSPAHLPVFAIQQQGIAVASVSSGPLTPENKIVDGRVLRLGFSSNLTMTQNNGRFLNPGESVWVTKMDAKADKIRATILTCDNSYAGLLSFQFTKEYLDNVRPEDIERAIDAFLISQGPPQTAVATGEPRVEQLTSQPRTMSPSTVSLGDSISQVVAVFGQPLQIVDLGSKKTYKYKDLKVIFVDGKVSDVQ